MDEIVTCWCGWTDRTSVPEMGARMLRAHQHSTHGDLRPHKPHECMCTDCDCTHMTIEDVCGNCQTNRHYWIDIHDIL